MRSIVAEIKKTFAPFEIYKRRKRGYIATIANRQNIKALKSLHQKSTDKFIKFKVPDKRINNLRPLMGPQKFINRMFRCVPENER